MYRTIDLTPKLHKKCRGIWLAENSIPWRKIFISKKIYLPTQKNKLVNKIELNKRVIV